MATYYALPTMSNWSDYTISPSTVGWALSSGGANTNITPTILDDVVFDGNSGTSRSIGFPDNNVYFKTLTTTGFIGTFSGGTLHANGNTNLTGITVSSTNLYADATMSLTCPTSGFFQLVSVANVTLTLQTNDLNVVALDVTTSSGYFNSNNKNVNATTVVIGASCTVDMGAGTWSLSSGSTDPWNADATSVIIPGTSTIKLTGNVGSSTQFTGSGKTYYNFWNATTGAGGVVHANGDTFNNFKINAGRKEIFNGSTTTTVASLTADGTALPITITNNGGGVYVLTKSGGGTIYFDKVIIDHCTVNPSSTWFGRYSTNGGNNTRITFIPNNSNFFTFC